MRQTALLATASLLLTAAPALAQSTGGNPGLALAALVSFQSPLVSPHDKTIMTYMLNGNLNFSYPAAKKITVKADAIVCRASNVDISVHSCELTFAGHKRTISGRTAHEMFATLIEIGIPGDGAAGTIFEALKSLDCSIDPNGVKQRDGGGASCSFTPGQ